MMVATAIMGFVLSAALLSLQAGTQASDVTTGRAEAQSSIRFALDRMIADMRAAGYDPTIANFDPIDSASMSATTVMLNTRPQRQRHAGRAGRHLRRLGPGRARAVPEVGHRASCGR